jgi:hypothetical protein
MVFLKTCLFQEIKENGIEQQTFFLFDTGFWKRTAMLDNDLLKEGNLPTNKM